MHNPDTTPKPAMHEQPSPEGLDETTCSPTPETDEAAENNGVGLRIWTVPSDFARYLERDRNEWKAKAKAGYVLATDIRHWQKMLAEEMRLRCGELSAQEIRNIKAVLLLILPENVRPLATPPLTPQDDAQR